ncbi:MAG: hypothetical protein MZV70_29925 [Desulfobacterales bacterium]|nr:hypothetical protein [Desulfobacterales bacterium]
MPTACAGSSSAPARRVFGVLPWFNHIRIESEDSVVIENPRQVDAADRPRRGALSP